MKFNLDLAILTVWCYATLNPILSAEESFNSPLNIRRLFQHTERRVHASKESPCCYPKQWQGLMFRYTAAFELQAAMYEDGINKRVAAVATVNTAEGSLNFTQIILFNPTDQSAVAYLIDTAAKTCKVGKVPNVTYDQVLLPCLNDKAKFFGALPIGDVDDASDNINVKSWMITADDLTYERVTTGKNCAPVFEILSGLTAKPSDIISSSYYFNIKTSISDPSVFKIPSYCSGSLEGKQRIEKRSATFYGVWDLNGF